LFFILGEKRKSEYKSQVKTDESLLHDSSSNLSVRPKAHISVNWPFF
jgi:hypothetical protein